MGKTKKDIDFIKLELSTSSIILDQESITEMEEEEREKYLADIGRAVLYLIRYYDHKFEDTPSMKNIKNEKAKMFYKSLLKAVNKAMSDFEVRLENSKKGGQNSWNNRKNNS